MKKNKTLKAQNNKIITSFILLNTIVFFFVRFSFSFEIENLSEASFFVVRLIWLIFAPILLFILNGSISSKYKERIVFWKWHNPLPGCEAFSKYAKTDDRVDYNILLERYGELPTNLTEQNKLWYKIYRKHNENIIIEAAHKKFLAARDMCSISLIIMFFLGLYVLIFGENSYKLIYFSFTLVQYAVLVLVAQNYGKRFVCNVLTLETSE